MGVFDIFSKRQKRLNKAAPDVYQYDKIPEPLRVQFVHIMNEAIGDFNQINGHPRRVYTTIHNILAREYGLFELEYGSKYEAIVNFFLSTKDHLRALDVIELGMRAIETECQEPYYKDLSQTTLTAPEAIEELNIRFREHGVGYEFVGGEIIRIDSQILHAEVVKPVLLLLQDSIYRGADEEYRNAFQHFRHGRYEEAINECLKAFESTMKAICAKRKWRVDQNATASKLLEVCFANGLVPPYLVSEFAALRSSLESGVPTVRNKQGGHGQGTVLRNVPAHLASYLLHLTGTSILFLVQCEHSL